MKYLDETGCCQWTPESYSYSQVSEQKRFEQTSPRGQRVSILGIWDPDESFDYALCVGGFNGERYLEVMNWLALKAAKTYAETKQLTFIVQDNCSIHKSKLVQQHWPQWPAQGLFVLFLPPYCSELNPIEGQWQQLKNHELAGRMFEYEDELSEAIVDGMIDRSIKGEYALDRFILNCT
ncbi:MAG: transposase [Cyanobacteria bacterium J06634_6]